MNLTCRVPDCGKRTEGTTGLCSSHNKALRKIVQSPIKRQSDKLKAKLDGYAERRRVFLKENPRCAVYPKLRSQEIHHMKGRTGDLLLDERYWLPVSRKAHVEITVDSKWAIEKGYSLPRTK